jgi:hypothetical protein
VLGVWEGRLLERLRVGHRHVGAGHPSHRGVEVVERLLLDQRGEVRPDPAVRPTLLHDHRAVGLLDRGEDRVEVERPQRTWVDHLGLDLVLGGQRLGRLLRGQRHARDAHQSHVIALAPHGGLAKALGASVLGHFPALPVERFVLDEDHRVLVPDRRL